jgi:hypothetical protein
VSLLAYSYRQLSRAGIAFVPFTGLSTTLKMVWRPGNTSPSQEEFLKICGP